MKKIEVYNQFPEEVISREFFESSLKKELKKCRLPTDFVPDQNVRGKYMIFVPDIATASRMTGTLNSMPGISAISKGY